MLGGITYTQFGFTLRLSLAWTTFMDVTRCNNPGIQPV